MIDRSFGPDRRASLAVRVRFDEATPSGAIRSSTLLRYASDLASVDSDRRGFSRAWYVDHGLAWLVRGVVLELLRPIAHGDELVGTTQVVGARKVLARRRTEFRTADGEVAAAIVVDWALISAAGSPTRIPPDFAPAFAMAEVNFAPIRVRAAAPTDRPVDTLELTVRPQELDPMDHVNNAVYLDWAEEAIGAAEASVAGSEAIGAAGAALPAESGAPLLEAVPRRWQLEYVSSAAAGDRAVATTWTDGAARCCRIEDIATGALFLAARLEA